MTPVRSGDKEFESLDGSRGSKFAERDDDNNAWVRRSKAHKAINETTQTLANICLKADL